MKTCDNCGVEVDEDLKRCPLCGERLAEDAEDAEDAEEVEEREEPAQETVSHARFWLWEVFSLLAFAAAIVIFAADFAFGFEVQWSRYPLIAIGFVWVSATIFLALAEHRILAVIAEAAALVAFLYGLELLTEAGGWFLSLALPIAVLTAIVYGGAAFAIHRRGLSALPGTAVIVLASGIFVVGVEVVIRRYLGDEVLVSWSLVAFACAMALFFLILWVNKRMRERHSEYRKVFHL